MFAYLHFVLLLGCVFVLLMLLVLLVLFGAVWCFLVLFVCAKSFCKKSKKFKTALITSFSLLLNSSYCKNEFFNHYNLFITIYFNYHNFSQLSQFFQLQQFSSIITIFFNYHDASQLSWSFLIITIFFITIFFVTIFFNLFTYCDTIFMKISVRIRSSNTYLLSSNFNFLSS